MADSSVYLLAIIQSMVLKWVAWGVECACAGLVSPVSVRGAGGSDSKSVALMSLVGTADRPMDHEGKVENWNRCDACS